MGYNNSRELCELIAKRSNGEALLAFSAGKDSVAAWVEMKKYFHKITPIYYYMIPNMSFIEKSLEYYENFFDTRIIRLPNPAIYTLLNAGVFQTPESFKVIKQYQFPLPTRDEMIAALKEDFDIDPTLYIGVGNRMADSPYRRMAIKRFGAIKEKSKTFYPVYDFLINDIVESIRSAGVMLPEDYHLFGKSFDGLDYRFIKPIQEYYPEDFQKIRNMFPLIDLEILRYEQV